MNRGIPFPLTLIWPAQLQLGRVPPVGDHPPYSWFHLMASAVVALLVFSSNGAADNGYRLGPQDKVRVKVYEWREARDEIFEWSALNDEFTVDAAGMLSIPLVGDVPAAGLVAREIAKSIGERLRTGKGLVEPPDASVEIVQFRPYYITGEVDKPGEFSYRPDLTVLQAVSLAGGLRRASGRLRIEREVIAGKGELQLLAMDANNLLARRARLQAELARAETIELPPHLKARQNATSIALLLEQERLIFEARRDSLKTELGALEQLRAYLEKEVASLQAQLAIEDTQLRLVKKELQGVSSLVERGLAVTPREIALQRTVAQIEGDRLRVGTSLLKARQDISRTEIAMLELRNKRTNEVTLELRQTQAKLDEIGRKSVTTDRLISEAEAAAADALLDRSAGLPAQPVYTILRRHLGQTAPIEASETTPIEPGDTIKVELGPPSEALRVPGATLELRSLTRRLDGVQSLLGEQTPISEN